MVAVVSWHSVGGTHLKEITLHLPGHKDNITTLRMIEGSLPLSVIIAL